jgi:hypothetical protein
MWVFSKRMEEYYNFSLDYHHIRVLRSGIDIKSQGVLGSVPCRLVACAYLPHRWNYLPQNNTMDRWNLAIILHKLGKYDNNYVT